MSLEQVVYRAKAKATGGRDGRATSSDGVLDVQLGVPKEMGGAGGDVRYVLVEPALTGVLAAAGLVGSVAANAPVDVRRAVQPALFADAPPEVLV